MPPTPVTTELLRDYLAAHPRNDPSAPFFSAVTLRPVSEQCRLSTCGDVEPMTGIEPAYSAWEADVLPLNYIGGVARKG